MSLTRKPVAILVEQKYEELELWYPYYRLKEEHAFPVLVGPNAGATYPSKLGYPATADVAARDVVAQDFAGIIIPGGFCPDYIRRSQDMLKLVRAAHAIQLPIAAICHGPWVLCSTTALKGRRATGFYAIQDDVVNAGAEWVDAEVVVDGHIITSRTPKDLPAFTAAFLKAIGV